VKFAVVAERESQIALRTKNPKRSADVDSHPSKAEG
jgi:hypothetical protein